MTESCEQCECVTYHLMSVIAKPAKTALVRLEWYAVSVAPHPIRFNIFRYPNV